MPWPAARTLDMTTLAMTDPLPSVAASFREAQSFQGNPWFRWGGGITLAVLAGSGGLLVIQGAGAVGAAVLGFTGVLLFLVGRSVLVTEVQEAGLRVRLWPLPAKTYAWTDIASAEVRQYAPLREYGGWGIRFGFSGMAWNAHGDRGVQLVLTSGRRVMIGSQRSDELAALIGARLR